MNCNEGYSLPILTGPLRYDLTGSCTKCDLTNCDKCDPKSGSQKCHKCIKGKTCTLDCSTHPWANIPDNENGECVAKCPAYTYLNVDHCEVTNKCDKDCLECVKDTSTNTGKCLKCADDRRGNPQVGYLGMCMNRQSCPNGAFLVETDTHHYCEKCEANCDKCLDATECTHCSVVPQYYLEDGNCLGAPLDKHYIETYDEFYS